MRNFSEVDTGAVGTSKLVFSPNIFFGVSLHLLLELL
jgi:hypothetical protein